MSTHRGLSAVVGTVFLIAVVMGALSYVTYSLDVMGNFSESLIAEESRQNAKQSEAFEISSIDVTGANKLDGVIKNTGEIPVKITTLWIDEQGVNDVVQKYTIDAEIAPGNTIDLASLIDVPMDSTKGYNMKVISSRGEVNSFHVNSLADENVYMSLTASPTIIPSTFTSTLIYTVVNNMSNGNYLYNLTPVMNDTKQTLGESSAGLTYDMIGSGPTPASYESLGPGEVAIFTYEVQITGDTDGDLQLFNVTLANANKGNEALASVGIKTVPLATDAGSALTSLGLTESDSDLTDVLYFHEDTTLTPNGEYSMDGSSPNADGETISPNGNTVSFLSAAMTADTIVPIGGYNVSMTYYSSMVPLGFPEPDLAFMMDCFECGDTADNEIASSNDDLGNNGFNSEGGHPEFFATGGPDGDGYYHFDDADNDYFWDEWSVSGSATDIDGYPDATAVWVRIENDGYKDDVAFVEAGDCCDDDHTETYGFYTASGGEIRYGWWTEHKHEGDQYSVYCETPGGDGKIYNDDTWYHVVGVRDDHMSCKLYIDGVLMDSNSKSDPGEDDVDVDYWSIGYDVINNQGADFDGDIASLMHWGGTNDNVNSIPFTGAEGADEVEDLYYTNYGNNATRLHYKVEVTNTGGTTVEHEIIPLTKVELPFKDVVLGNHDDQGSWIDIDTNNGTDQKYHGDANGGSIVFFTANLTAHSTSVANLLKGERLKVTLDWNGFDEQNLPINIMFDDTTYSAGTGWSLIDGPTFLQTPEPNPRWPTFLSFDSREPVTYRAFNEGPEGVWFTYPGTRLVLTSLDGTTSYGATPQYVNKTTAPSVSEAVISTARDSMYIPNQYYAEIEFWPIQAPPDANSNISGCAPECEVPNGDYDAALYLQGYDEAGETFKKTVNLGLVHITGNP
ncbi:MAG: hypothetical protein ACW9XH_06735 [Candidatus Nitrosopumilus sp. bin_32a]